MCLCIYSIHVEVQLLGEQCIVGSRVWNSMPVLISQPGIVERKIPIASLRHWDPPFTAVTMVTTGMTKYQTNATLCLQTDISFTWLYARIVRQLDRADNLFLGIAGIVSISSSPPLVPPPHN